MAGMGWNGFKFHSIPNPSGIPGLCFPLGFCSGAEGDVPSQGDPKDTSKLTLAHGTFFPALLCLDPVRNPGFLPSKETRMNSELPFSLCTPGNPLLNVRDRQGVLGSSRARILPNLSSPSSSPLHFQPDPEPAAPGAGNSAGLVPFSCWRIRDQQQPNGCSWEGKDSRARGFSPFPHLPLRRWKGKEFFLSSLQIPLEKENERSQPGIP